MGPTKLRLAEPFVSSAPAPDCLQEEVSADYNDMIYADSTSVIAARRKAFIRKWRLKCRAVADGLKEASDKLFTFTRFPRSHWKSIRTSNAIERLHEEFKRANQDPNRAPS
jgi:putative transposase